MSAKVQAANKRCMAQKAQEAPAAQVRKWGGQPVVACVLALGLLGADGAQGQAQEWSDLRLDPLLTLPSVLAAGVTLPGDKEALTCNGLPLAPLKGQALSLADAVDIGLCANPQVRSAWAAIKVQAAGVGEAKAAHFPTLMAAASLSRSKLSADPALPATLNQGHALNVGLSWRLFDFGGRAANQAGAAFFLDAALASHNAVLQKTLAAVVEAYFDAQTAWASLQAKQKTEALAARTKAAAGRREALGAGAQSDTLQASTSLAKAALDRSYAHGAYQKSKAVLVYVLGLPPETPLQLLEENEDDAQRRVVSQDLQAWLEEAQRAHPAIVTAQALLGAAKQRVKAAEAVGRPTLDLAANSYQNGRPNQGVAARNSSEQVLSLTLNLPLFDGFAQHYKVRGAQAQVEQQQANAQDTRLQVLMEVVKAYADSEAALENLTASRQLQEAAQEAMRSVQRKFDRGAADILEILSAQRALADAQQQRVRSIAEWRSSRLKLMASAGVLGIRRLGGSY